MPASQADFSAVLAQKELQVARLREQALNNLQS